MRFGVREICNVVLRAKATQTLGSRKFYKNEPVLYFDTLKTSSLEGASTTVYATGGRGNTRLVAWEGERTLTFTMEDALISPEGFAILSGAGLIAATEKAPVYVHTQSQIELEEDNTIVLPDIACWNKYAKNGEYEDYRHNSADIFVMVLKDGEIAAEPCVPVAVVPDFLNKTTTLTCYSHAGRIEAGDIVLVDYYVKRTGGAQLIEITPDKFGGNYYLEASTLFRRESDGVDMPAEFIIPNCKVQSNFNFAMASSGDPSTFTFTMDAFPDYTKFDQTHKVLAAIQVIEDQFEEEEEERAACEKQEVFDIEALKDIGIEVAYDNSSTDTDAKVVLTGTIKSLTKDELSSVGFGGTEIGEAIDAGLLKMNTVNINLPVQSNTAYKLRTVSPTHKYYPNDGNMIKDDNGNIICKEQKKAIGTDAQWTITAGITNKKTPLTFELYRLANDSDEKGILVYSLTITNKLQFSK